MSPSLDVIFHYSSYSSVFLSPLLFSSVYMFVFLLSCVFPVSIYYSRSHSKNQNYMFSTLLFNLSTSSTLLPFFKLPITFHAHFYIHLYVLLCVAGLQLGVLSAFLNSTISRETLYPLIHFLSSYYTISLLEYCL